MSGNRKTTILILLCIPVICLSLSIRFRLNSIGPLDIVYVRSQKFNARNMHKEMAVAYEKLLKKHPNRTDLFYPLGWAYYKTGRIDEAYTCMKKYNTESPYHPEWQDHYIEIVRKASSNAL